MVGNGSAGVLTAAGAGISAWIGAGRATEAARQRESAAAREEWFRRLQWAGGLALSGDERTRVAGLAVLEALAGSPLAGPAELDLLFALNDNTSLDSYRHHLDERRVEAEDEVDTTREEDPDDDE